MNIVTELLNNHPLSFAVTGQPNKPSDQGSIERTNQEVKKVISKFVLEEKLKGGTNVILVG